MGQRCGSTVMQVGGRLKGLVRVIERQKSEAEAGYSVKGNCMQVTPCK